MGILLESDSRADNSIHSLPPILAWQCNISSHHLILRHATVYTLTARCPGDTSSLALQLSSSNLECTYDYFFISFATNYCCQHDSAGVGHVHLCSHLLLSFMGTMDCCVASFRRAHRECSTALMHCASNLSLTLRGQLADRHLSTITHLRHSPSLFDYTGEKKRRKEDPTL